MSTENDSVDGSGDSFETRTSCPLCQEELIINWQGDEIPYFGEVMYISTSCYNCGFRFADTMIMTQKDPVRFEMMVERSEDLNARVIRSTSGTIRIPDLGIDVEPGSVSESYVTNIEGILERVRSVVVTATEWVKDEPEAHERGLELQKLLEKAIEGEYPLKVIIEDPLGNSAIISEKAISRTLSAEEAANLHSGMIVFDVDSSELDMDSSEKVRPIGNDYK
ncbi:MAG: ZPR1 zinc finger domain-containing protein [Halobacteriota archaeon]